MESPQNSPNNRGKGHRKRLREKFLQGGLKGFHDYEIIELLLSLNTPRKDCKESAKLLLKQFKTLQGVFEADNNALCRIKGVGPANSFGLKLIKQVSDRYLENKIISQDVVQNPEDLQQYLNQLIGHKTKEVFTGIFLDAKNRVLTSRILFTGTLTTSSVYPREVIKKAIEYNAAAIIFAHNHPSGDIKPSKSDIKITKDLLFALKYVGIVVHEHMIIGNEGFYSFAAHGLISQFNMQFKEGQKTYEPKE
ncbi:MAG: JAB domain-containing protein [Desulfobacula sp.]|nr:JAB domain-containing protein [Desulfobacula sp.]